MCTLEDDDILVQAAFAFSVHEYIHINIHTLFHTHTIHTHTCTPTHTHMPTRTCTHTHTHMPHILHSSAGAPQLPRINNKASLDADTSLMSEGAADLGNVPPSALEQTLMEMDRLGMEVTRDLLISALCCLY